ncbi:glycoside hydrolase family protein [Pseudotamlana carrageenivorans]|uniref:Lysozyme n=1 Tax=Pseudotamlana carrageenivorans TaxID=2069432 RepID=A0A2I7SDY0_9FLAO|nr:glycoside hydrolase family protein [Tamlana carrageenivorans]AUS04112.1 hypothetical protein C1A40_00835 [Tamlana carrageenivorans]
MDVLDQEYKKGKYQEEKAETRRLPSSDMLWHFNVNSFVRQMRGMYGKIGVLRKGDKGEIVRELNIRLSGFGGNIPTDEFTDRTVAIVKQFQRDYMKIAPTGEVGRDELKAIDDFSEKYDISDEFWGQIKCSCVSKGETKWNKLRNKTELNNCDGFGDHTGIGAYRENKPKSEGFHMYEYPGIHRSLLFAVKALQFYLSKQTTYKLDHVSSGYRCRFKNYKTTNHQGKAIDLQFSKGDWKIRNAKKKNVIPLRSIRDDFYVKYLGAQEEWTDTNKFSIEPIGLEYHSGGELRYDRTFSWIHMDVRRFESIYLVDDYFCKNSNSLNKKSMLSGEYEKSSSESSTNSEERIDPAILSPSDSIIEFIKDWEKFKPNVYNDSNGYATIGYGHLIKRDNLEDIIIPQEFSNGLTEIEATKLLTKDIKKFELALKRDVKVKLHQREFDALIDLLYNCGEYFLARGKAPRLYSALKEKRYNDAATEFLDIENKTRRKQNYEIFTKGNYDSTH